MKLDSNTLNVQKIRRKWHKKTMKQMLHGFL